MAKPIHHWPDIKAEYVEGIVDQKGNRAFLSMQEIGIKYGIPPASIRRKAARDSWLLERNAFVTKWEQARQEKRSEALAGQAAEFDIKCLKVANALISHIAKDLQDAAQGKVALSPAEKSNLSQALKNAQQTGRLALGESTEKQDGPPGAVLGNKIEVVFVNAPNGQS